MEEQEKAPTLFNHAAKWGVICAAVGIVLSVLFYVIDYALLASFKFLGIILVVSIGLVIYAGIDYRKTIGGYLSYGKAWQHGWVVFAVSGVISLVFQMLLYFVIDSELPAKMTDVIVDNTREMMANFGAPEDQIDKQLEQVRIDTTDRFTVFGLIKGFAIQLIFMAIPALITAIFVRKNPPIDQM